jgi:hypothetical protein
MSGHVPRWLNVSTTVAIAANFAAFGWGLVDHPHRELAEHAEDVTLVFFAVEMALRLKYQGANGFFRDKWNVADLAIITVAIMPLLAELAHHSVEGVFGGAAALVVLRLVRLVRMAHMMRHSAHFRVVTRLRWWHFRRGFTPVTEAEWGSAFESA